MRYKECVIGVRGTQTDTVADTAVDYVLMSV